MRRKKLIAISAIVAAAILLVAAGVYYWTQTDPRLQVGMTEKDVSDILGSQGTTVLLDRPPADVPYATYYVFYDRGPDMFGQYRVVTVYYDRSKQLVKYDVAPLAHPHAP